jgi:death-on-curing protein
MSEPVWVEIEALVVLHARSLALHGGPPGVRDHGLLASALERPKNRHYYEDVSGLADLAATYAIGISGNHPFIDGNKRAAFQALVLFLRVNGVRLVADQVDATRTILAVAAGKMQVDELAGWVRANTKVA